MFKSYLKIAYRNIWRHKAYSFINIAGLAIGMACCLLIFLYIHYALSYDRFHSKGDRIYRVLRETQQDDGDLKIYAGISGPFAPDLMENFPEVEQTVRIVTSEGFYVQSEGKQFNHPGYKIWFAEPQFLEMFDFKLLAGDRKTALRIPYSVVLSEATARRYFGTKNPIGKVITFTEGYFQGDFTVTGVISVPEQSSMQFDIVGALLPAVITDQWLKSQWENWQAVANANRSFITFILLREGVNPEEFAAKLPEFLAQYLGQEVSVKNAYHLQPLDRLHLFTSVEYADRLVQEPVPMVYGDIQAIYLFLAIAFLIMLIACVNFINLSTARSANRAKEVGLRKVAGAYRSQIVRQFLGEAVILAFLAGLLMIGLVEVTLPGFSRFVSADLTPERNIYYMIVPGLVTIVGLLTGIYPAFFLSAFEPVMVLKGRLISSLRGLFFRKGLVVFQFAMSILLIIGTITIYRQLNYMQSKNLGFNKNHLIVMPLLLLDEQKKRNNPEERLSARYNMVKQAFLKHPNVLMASASRYPLGPGPWGGGSMRQVYAESGDIYQMRVQEADEDFLSTYKINLVDGRSFSPEEMTRANSIILNEIAVKTLGLKDPIGKQLALPGPNQKRTIVGVVKDFHTQPLHEKIEPLIIWNTHRLFRRITLRVKAENLHETLTFLEQTWKRFLPDLPFEFSFVDESFDRAYRKDRQVGQIVGAFAILAILVACLGLFGLSAFTAEQRTKEIGVRKVLGASVRSIVLLLSNEFLRLVLIANLIAWPVAYFLVGRWLENFAYRVDLSWWVFALGGFLALLIALLTVIYQTTRAALANPVNALRHE